MSIPPVKLSNEWLIRLLFAMASALATGGSMYAAQWWLFLKDAPSRAEVKQEIRDEVSRSPWIADKPSVMATLNELTRTVARFQEGQDRIISAINEQALAVRELQTLIKKERLQ